MKRPISYTNFSISQKIKAVVLFIVILFVIIIILLIFNTKNTPQAPVASKTDSTKVLQIIKDTSTVKVNVISKPDSVQNRPPKIKLNKEYTKPKGTFTDPRDSQTYKWVRIGKQIWMAENLAYKADKGCWAYDNNIANVEVYGYLYEWETAINVCPAGWHLPNMDAFKLLRNSVGFYDAIGNLKSINGWTSHNREKPESDQYGFTALPAGAHSLYNEFHGIGGRAFWWSSTSIDSIYAWYFEVADYPIGVGDHPKLNAFSVRCLKD